MDGKKIETTIIFKGSIKDLLTLISTLNYYCTDKSVVTDGKSKDEVKISFKYNSRVENIIKEKLDKYSKQLRGL